MTTNHKSDQRGIAHLIFIVIVVAVIAVIGLIGWRVSSNKKSSNGTGSSAVVSNKAIQNACNTELKDKDLCKFASNYNLTSASYHSVITSVADGKTSVTTMDVDGKNNSSMVISENSNESSAFISLNKATYIKDETSGSWLKYAAAADTATPPAETNPTSDIKVNTSDLTQNNTVSYKSLGKEACGQLTCFKYQLVDTANPGTTQYLWFDNKDYVMQRWSSKDANGSMDMIFVFRSVTIKEPSPTTNYSAQSNADLQAAQAAAAAAAGDTSGQ